MSSGAVFLSYAHDDAAAVRRIADALRSGGIEVWFDESNLIGGDVWDAKIRDQIRTCALLVPVISSQTQARREGYFRLEWNLADERTRQMAAGTPFLIPVVLDDTSDRGAVVPKSFRNYQWARLPQGETSPAFVERVRALLGALRHRLNPTLVQSLNGREEAVFAQALAQPRTHRASYLAQACAGDTGLLGKMLAMLAEHESPEGLRPTRVALAAALAEEQPGVTINRFKLVQKIGEGGCGAVWLAEQTEPVSRSVALKVIKLGMDTRDVIARFEAERQLLAMMDHPGIAKVFDAGTTDTGRPFFVMEFVAGLPITRFCDERGMGLRDRIDLFIQTCQAVQHAHQKGVIHRDLKPSNILVTEHEDRGLPKVIDFGIAKATGSRPSNEAVVTAIGNFLGTPAYMSPEQADFSRLNIDTRSDVYSLGSILYELLTGRTPFDVPALMATGIDEVRRHLREVEPPRPSVCLGALGAEEAANVARQRDTVPAKLAKQVRGDLDWIVMRCLEKDRARRYETATALADDLARFLAYEPVLARPPSSAYRISKFVRRNKLATGASAAVAIALVLGTLVSLWQAARASQAERVSSAVNEFLTSDLLLQADSRAQAEANATPTPNLTVRDALDRAADKVGRRFEGQPLTEAAVREAIGSAYEGVGSYAKAATHHERTWQLRKKMLGDEDPQTLKSLNALANALLWQGKATEATPLFEQALTARRKVLGPEHPDTAASINNLASAQFAQGKAAEAAKLFAQAFALRQRILGAEDPATLKSMNNLANAYRSLGRSPDAAKLLEQTVEIRKRVSGAEHPNTLGVISNLAQTYAAMGRHSEAATLHQEVLGIRQRILGPEHPDTLNSMNNVALALAAQGRYPAAAALHTEALETQKRVLGREHPITLSSMNNLASALEGDGRPAEAVPLHAETLAIRQRVLGPEHPHTLLSMHNLARAYRAVRRFEEARSIDEQTLERRRRILGPEHPDTLVSMGSLASSYLGVGRVADAVRLLEGLLELRQQKLGFEHPDTVRTRAELMAARTATGGRDGGR